MLKPKYNFLGGELLLVDKPLTWTSFDVVNKLRYSVKRATGVKKPKVGHAGTLDPLATGLLLICTGKFTKRQNEYQGLDKEYTGTFCLGASTPSVDLETEIDQRYSLEGLKEAQLLEAAQALTGTIQQIPPGYSAMHVDGERSYLKVRRGEEVILKAREVEVPVFEIETSKFPEIAFRIVCSKGTYIRSLVRDFGASLNNGAYLSALRRTRIGEYRVENADTVPDLTAHFEALLVDASEKGL
ncbi:MAG: tRNA pseudouridine(55) synthase TruB [Salibacteraceae bacterium]